MLQPISDFLPALKGGANLAGPASESGESLPSLAESFPVTMSGDAWQSAALFFIRQRENRQAWDESSEFLKSQELAAHGLRLLPARSASGASGAPGARALAARSVPVGNTGITSTIDTGRSNG